MTKGLRAALYTTATLAVLLGSWGLVSNAVLPLTFDEKKKWNFFGTFEFWDPSGPSRSPHPNSDFPWWAISLQTPCPYLDPLLASSVGDVFYALCLLWGIGTVIMLRFRSVAGKGYWLVCGTCWLIGLGGIISHVVVFAFIAIEAWRAGLIP